MSNRPSDATDSTATTPNGNRDVAHNLDDGSCNSAATAADACLTPPSPIGNVTEDYAEESVDATNESKRKRSVSSSSSSSRADAAPPRSTPRRQNDDTAVAHTRFSDTIRRINKKCTTQLDHVEYSAWYRPSNLFYYQPLTSCNWSLYTFSPDTQPDVVVTAHLLIGMVPRYWLNGNLVPYNNTWGPYAPTAERFLQQLIDRRIGHDQVFVTFAEAMTKNGKLCNTKFKAYVIGSIHAIAELRYWLHRCVLMDESGFNFINSDEQYEVAMKVLEPIRKNWNNETGNRTTDRWHMTNGFPSQPLVVEVMTCTQNYNCVMAALDNVDMSYNRLPFCTKEPNVGRAQPPTHTNNLAHHHNQN